MDATLAELSMAIDLAKEVGGISAVAGEIVKNFQDDAEYEALLVALVAKKTEQKV